jgi:hypothetical protein
MSAALKPEPEVKVEYVTGYIPAHINMPLWKRLAHKLMIFLFWLTGFAKIEFDSIQTDKETATRMGEQPGWFSIPLAVNVSAPKETCVIKPCVQPADTAKKRHTAPRAILRAVPDSDITKQRNELTEVHQTVGRLLEKLKT